MSLYEIFDEFLLVASVAVDVVGVVAPFDVLGVLFDDGKRHRAAGGFSFTNFEITAEDFGFDGVFSFIF